ncbi:hypothetical protein ACFE04_018474 [Oxalis oulophora]
MECKNHPYHNPYEQGVCPFCLREKLSQLNPTLLLSRFKRILTVPNSSSSSTSSVFSSRCDSPVDCGGGRPHRKVTQVLNSMSLKLTNIYNNNNNNNNNNNSSSSDDRLKKSRSIAFFPRINVTSNIVGEVKNTINRKNNNKNVVVRGGFWSKLLPSSRRQVLIQHPRTLSLRLF